jgi:general secretion pathway protein L
MPDSLFIRLDDPSADVVTVVLNAEGRVTEPVRRNRLEAVASRTAGRRVVVLVPATETVTTRANVPKSSQARLRQLLPFSLEETFATDIESLHFAAGRRSESGTLAVSVVARERLDAWLAAVRAAGISPDAMYSEADGIPDTPSTLNLLVEGTRIYGRRPGEAPFVLEGLSLAEVLDLLTGPSAEGAGPQHLLVYMDAEAKRRRLPELTAIQSRVSSLDVKELADGLLPRLAVTLAFEPGTNLLQGSYGPKSDVGALLKPWFVAASLLVAWVALTVVAQAAEYFSLRSENQALTAELETICARSFGSTGLSTCTAEARSRLAAAGERASAGGESFLSTLTVIADAQAADSRIQAMSYRNRIVDLQLLVPSIASLDTFQQNITSTNRFDVRIQSTVPNDGGLEGRVQVVGALP